LQDKGKVADLELKEMAEWPLTVQLSVTRWANNCSNDVNSHPHVSNSGDLVIIHNGIIENYAPLKKNCKRAMFFFEHWYRG
jgi:glucosamine--fructose-6-phosphate aminotransferase (isomerizing)